MSKYTVISIVSVLGLLMLQPYSYCQLKTSNEEIKQKTTVVTSKVLDKRQTGLRVYKHGKCWNGYTLYRQY